MSDAKPPPFVYHALPDELVLAALGRIALRHGQLDNQLRMLVKDFTGVSQAEALDATVREGSGSLRGRVLKLAKSRLGDGSAFVKMQALFERASQATARRNELVHWVWGIELDGGPMVRIDDHTFQPAPTLSDLGEIEDCVATILDELIAARMDGFIAEALKSKPEAKRSRSGRA